jgi:hypothetical protein
MQQHESENNLTEITDLSTNWDEASLAKYPRAVDLVVQLLFLQPHETVPIS